MDNTSDLNPMGTVTFTTYGEYLDRLRDFIGAGQAGHEAIGPQPTDALTVSEADIRAGVVKIAKQAQDYARGAVVDAAITALHRQHTSDGKPARYLPEG